jgi:drug/metabolite transporter (DMT)-like permease
LLILHRIPVACISGPRESSYSSDRFSMSDNSTSDSQRLSLRQLLLADLALLAVAVIWGVNIPVMKVALESGITPYALNAIRLVVSAIVLLGCAGWEYRSGVRPSAGISRGRIVIYAMIVSVAYQYLFLMAVSRTTSANVALIMATVPMWTALAARLFLKEILPVMAWVGLLIAFAGTMIVTVQKQATPVAETVVSESVDSERGKDASKSRPGPIIDEVRSRQSDLDAATRFTGNMIALLAALTWAGGTVFSRPMLRLISPVQLAACSATIGLPFHVLFAWPTLAVAIPLLQETSLQLCILYSGILSTGMALAMWSYGVKHAGAAQATMFQNLSPIVAIVSAWLWRGESISIAQTIGGVMIISGLVIMRRSRN